MLPLFISWESHGKGLLWWPPQRVSFAGCLCFQYHRIPKKAPVLINTEMWLARLGQWGSWRGADVSQCPVVRPGSVCTAAHEDRSPRCHTIRLSRCSRLPYLTAGEEPGVDASLPLGVCSHCRGLDPGTKPWTTKQLGSKQNQAGSSSKSQLTVPHYGWFYIWHAEVCVFSFLTSWCTSAWLRSMNFVIKSW